MDGIKESIRYKELTNKCGNRYAAIQQICEKAHRNIEDCNGELSASKCITWAIYDKKPKYESKRSNYINEYIYQVLCNIDDESVKDAVKQSMSLSISNHHLIYNYGELSDINMQTRIRVICNMIWYSLYPEKYEEANNGR